MRRALAVVALAALAVASCASSAPPSVLSESARFAESVALPDADQTGQMTVERALLERRSGRDYAASELPHAVIGQLFWAGQGITDESGHRTAPSAGATYPLELYVITATSIGHYVPERHHLEVRTDTTTLAQLAEAAFDQRFVGEAPAVFVIAGVQSRTEAKYGAVADDLMNREAGHAAQNILLQATALGLAAVPVGGFDPDLVRRLLALAQGEEVLYLLPIGYSTRTGES